MKPFTLYAHCPPALRTPNRRSRQHAETPCEKEIISTPLLKEPTPPVDYRNLVKNLSSNLPSEKWEVSNRLQIVPGQVFSPFKEVQFPDREIYLERRFLPKPEPVLPLLQSYKPKNYYPLQEYVPLKKYSYLKKGNGAPISQVVSTPITPVVAPTLPHAPPTPVGQQTKKESPVRRVLLLLLVLALLAIMVLPVHSPSATPKAVIQNNAPVASAPSEPIHNALPDIPAPPTKAKTEYGSEPSEWQPIPTGVSGSPLYNAPLNSLPWKQKLTVDFENMTASWEDGNMTRQLLWEGPTSVLLVENTAGCNWNGTTNTGTFKDVYIQAAYVKNGTLLGLYLTRNAACAPAEPYIQK